MDTGRINTGQNEIFNWIPGGRLCVFSSNKKTTSGPKLQIESASCWLCESTSFSKSHPHISNKWVKWGCATRQYTWHSPVLMVALVSAALLRNAMWTLFQSFSREGNSVSFYSSYHANLHSVDYGDPGASCFCSDCALGSWENDPTASPCPPKSPFLPDSQNPTLTAGIICTYSGTPQLESAHRQC